MTGFTENYPEIDIYAYDEKRVIFGSCKRNCTYLNMNNLLCHFVLFLLFKSGRADTSWFFNNIDHLQITFAFFSPTISTSVRSSIELALIKANESLQEGNEGHLRVMVEKLYGDQKRKIDWDKMPKASLKISTAECFDHVELFDSQ